CQSSAEGAGTAGKWAGDGELRGNPGVGAREGHAAGEAGGGVVELVLGSNREGQVVPRYRGRRSGDDKVRRRGGSDRDVVAGPGDGPGDAAGVGVSGHQSVVARRQQEGGKDTHAAVQPAAEKRHGGGIVAREGDRAGVAGG